MRSYKKLNSHCQPMTIRMKSYKDKYYQQIHGGAMGSAFTQVLANIYMLGWEQNLIQH